jgi:hypothetical protein
MCCSPSAAKSLRWSLAQRLLAPGTAWTVRLPLDCEYRYVPARLYAPPPLPPGRRRGVGLARVGGRGVVGRALGLLVAGRFPADGRLVVRGGRETTGRRAAVGLRPEAALLGTARVGCLAGATRGRDVGGRTTLLGERLRVDPTVGGGRPVAARPVVPRVDVVPPLDVDPREGSRALGDGRRRSVGRLVPAEALGAVAPVDARAPPACGVVRVVRGGAIPVAPRAVVG